MQNKNNILKLVFLIAVGLIVLFIFYNQFLAPKKNIKEPTSEPKEVSENYHEEIDIDELKEKYGGKEVDIYSEKLKDYEDLGVFDFESYYKKSFSEKEYKEIKEVASLFTKSLIQGEDKNNLSNLFDLKINEDINKDSYNKKNKIKDLNVYPIEPEVENEIRLGVNILFENKKSEVIFISFIKNDNKLIIQDVILEWSDF